MGAQVKSNSKGRMTMHQGSSARRTGRIWSLTVGRRRALAVMTAALLVALPFTAHAQTAGQTDGQASPGAAISPAPTAAAPVTGAAPSVPSQSAQTPAGGGAVSPAPSAAPTSAAPAASAPPAPASAALPGEHMISGADLPEDLSPWGMFENSDLVVKAVIIGLALASLVTWTVWVAKTWELRSARGEVRRDLRVLNNSMT